MVAKKPVSSASQPTEPSEASRLGMAKVQTEIEKFGRFPSLIANPVTAAEQEEGKLHMWVYHQRKNVGIPAEKWSELRRYGKNTVAEKFLKAVEDLGYYPRESKRNPTESKLAMDLRRAHKSGVFQPAELKWLDDFRLRTVHHMDQAISKKLIEEAEQPPDPMLGFAGDASSRLAEMGWPARQHL